MARTRFELACVIKRYAGDFVAQCTPNVFQLNVLNALGLCRTAPLGGHKNKCDR